MEGETRKKRKVLLMGAGAAISWGGPSTSQVTDLILGRLEPDTARNTDLKLTNLIYNFFHIKYSQNSTYKEANINFEDIINVVEELILFYYEEEKEGANHILPHFFDIKPDFKKDLEACFTNEKSLYENLLDSLKDIFSSITTLVHRYSWHYSELNSKILPCEEHFDLFRKNERSLLIELFNSWAFKIGLNNSFTRVYTLNYDKLFKILFENLICKNNFLNQSEVFDGFETGFYEANLKRILFNRNEHCHFNLHGSIYWHLIKRNRNNGLEDFHLVSNSSPYSQLSNGGMISELEKGRPFVHSNIIAGYKKTQRSFSTPFKQMQASFEMDCLEGDEIFIVGYSFSDSHINAGINTVINNNENCKIHIIDPSFKDGELALKISNLINLFPSLLDINKLVKDSNNEHPMPKVFLQGRLNIYDLTYEEYLKFENGPS